MWRLIGAAAAAVLILTALAPPAGAAVSPVKFAPAVNYSLVSLGLPNKSHVPAVGLDDFNGDGLSDIVAADYANSCVAVWLNHAGANFGAATAYASGSTPKSLVVSDFNRDSVPDVLTPDESVSTLSVMLGDGKGGLLPKKDFAAGDKPHVVAVGDFNGDASSDVAIVNDQATGFLCILLGDGQGGFGSPATTAVAAAPRSVAVGDFNDDGKDDLAIAFETNDQVGILLGDGGGHFGNPVYFKNVGKMPKSVAVGDLNHDGKQDLVVANEGTPASKANGSVSVLLGNGKGGFAAPVQQPLHLAPKFVTLGDLNNDGNVDAVVADYGDTDSGDFNGKGDVAILLGEGNGTIDPATFVVADNGPKWVAIGDLNRDHVADLVVANNDSGDVSVLLGADAIAPATTATGGDPAAWYNKPATVTLTATDAGSGVVSIRYRVDASAWATIAGTTVKVPIAAPADHAADGTHTISYFATDRAGNVETTKSLAVNIDTTPPEITATGADDSWHDADVTVRFSASDSLSGVATTEHRVGGGSWTAGSSATVSATSGDGQHDVSGRCTDRAGNTATAGPFAVFIDTTPPVTQAAGYDAAWHSSPVTVTFSASDLSSGVARTEWAVDDAQAWTTGPAVTISPDGIHTIRFRSLDSAGNVEKTQSCTVNMDTHKPATRAPRASSILRGRTANLRYSVLDVLPGSATANVTIRIKTATGRVVRTLHCANKPVNVPLSTKYVCRLARGTYRFFIYATDAAGNTQKNIASNRLTVR
jgi:hypothetical protein